MCGGCGQSGIHSLQIGNTREFTSDTAVCLGCQVKEIYLAQNAEEVRTSKGLKVFAVNGMGPRYDDDDE